jgi:hypothetical protein
MPSQDQPNDGEYPDAQGQEEERGCRHPKTHWPIRSGIRSLVRIHENTLAA